MKRLHVSLAVDALEPSVRFYSTLFAAEPTVLEPDYAKWMLEDPRVNFSISTRGQRPGLDHLGIQVEDAEELTEVYDRLKAAGRPVLEQGEVTCCYARSEKAWISDPQGVPWEAFLTHGRSTVYGEDTDLDAAAESTACCARPARATKDAAAAPKGCCG